jgi:Tol biopolymer transport system component
LLVAGPDFIAGPGLVAAAQMLSRVSVASNGSQANGPSFSPAVSMDGRFVAFASDATNLVLGDTNGVRDVFVRDLATGTTTRVSVASDGTPGNGASGVGHGALSAGGRIVAFSSVATTLGGCDNGAGQIFVHDRATGVTTCISVGPGRVQGDGSSFGPQVSADGRFVAFTSGAPNLLGGCGSVTPFRGALVHDRVTGITTCLAEIIGGGGVAAISSDGRFVLVNTFGLPPGFGADLFDRLAGTSTPLPGIATSLSGDGRFAGVVSAGRPPSHVFLVDVPSASIHQLDVGNPPGGPSDHSVDVILSADARIVAFMSFSAGLVAGDTNGVTDIFVHDELTHRIRRVNVAPNGGQANGASGFVAVSADGRAVAFESLASNLVPGDTNGVSDVFVAVSIFPGGVFVATGDLDGLGRAEIVTGAGAGGEAWVRAFAPDGFPRPTSFLAYPAGFSGGVRVAACDFDADGRAEIVTAPGPGGGPHVRVVKLDPAGYPVADLASAFVYPPGFTGGVFVACGDVDGDGMPELVVGPEAGGGPHVRVLKVQPAVPGGLVAFLDFLAYGPPFTGGVRVAAGDVDGSGRASMVLGPGPGGGPHVRVVRYTGSQLTDVANFFAYHPAFSGGVFVAAGHVTGDGRAEILTGAGAGGGPHVRLFTGTGGAIGLGFLAYPSGFNGGVRVAIGDLTGTGTGQVVTAAGPGGGPHVGAFVDGAGTPAGTSFFAY